MRYLTNIISCDRRSLALFRVAVAIAGAWLFMLSDSVVTANNLPTIYSWFDHPYYRHLLDALGLAAFAAMFFGYYTRLATSLAWLMLASVLAANGQIVEYSQFLAVMIAAAMLPTGIACSVDEAMDKGLENRQAVKFPVFTIISAGSLLLFVCLAASLVSVVTRTGWLPDYSTVFASPLVVRTGITVAGLMILLLGTGVIRLIAVLMLLVAFAYYSAQDRISGIPAVSIGLLALALLPAWGWNQISQHFFVKRHQLRIYYDEPCGFCRKVCFLFVALMRLGTVQIRTAQTSQEILGVMRRHDSWVVYDYDGQQYLHWGAVLLLMKRSPLFWPLGYLLSALGMAKWGVVLYRLIGHSRGVLSKLTAVVLPYKPLSYGSHITTTAPAIVWLILFLATVTGTYRQYCRAELCHWLPAYAGLAVEAAPFIAGPDQRYCNSAADEDCI